jgi:hypothetical protein
MVLEKDGHTILNVNATELRAKNAQLVNYITHILYNKTNRK